MKRKTKYRCAAVALTAFTALWLAKTAVTAVFVYAELSETVTAQGDTTQSDTAQDETAQDDTEQDEKEPAAVISECALVAPVQLVCYPETQEEIEEENYYNSLELLAICVEAEAGNQGLQGKRMVVDVILNRVDDTSGIWGNDIESVITGKYEFTSYWDGGMESVVEPSEETFQAVRMELEERSYPGIYYFTAGEWSKYGTPWRKVGDHYFSTK